MIAKKAFEGGYNHLKLQILATVSVSTRPKAKQTKKDWEINFAELSKVRLKLYDITSHGMIAWV
jgi:hypothetical protein